MLTDIKAQLERLLDGSSGCELRPVVLPIFTLVDMLVCGGEMLIRVPEPFRDPCHLFDECSQAGMLVQMDEACLRATVTHAKVEKPSDRIHFNIYQQTLLSLEPQMLVELVRENIPEGIVCFELIESNTMLNPEELSRRIEYLQSENIQIAIDDVGYGSSSLETLVTLQPEIIKVDRSFVTNAYGDIRLERRLARLVAVAHALGAKIVAEGMDTPKDVRLGRELGIAMGQGLMTGPLPV